MADALLIHNRFAERLQREPAAVVLVDCQERLIERSCPDPLALHDNLLGLARLARAFALPVVLGMRSDPTSGPLLPDLDVEAAGAIRVERVGGPFWADAASVAAVRRCGRRALLVGGIDPESGLAGLSLGARAAGFAVRAVADAAAGGTPSSERIGEARLSGAGIEVTSWVAVMAEFASATQPPSAAVSAALSDSLARYHAGAIGWGDKRRSRVR